MSYRLLSASARASENKSCTSVSDRILDLDLTNMGLSYLNDKFRSEYNRILAIDCFPI